MDKKTENLINKWYDIYWLYMQYNGVTVKEEVDVMWTTRTNSMIEYWNKMEQGDVPKTFPDFNVLLLCTMDYYERINEYYKRFGGREPIVIPNAGGRVWL